MVVLTEKFRFIRDDVFLCPWVDSKTGEQKLVMQKINLETNEVEFEDFIDCIHTAVTEIHPETFEDFHNDAHVKEFIYNKTLEIRSSEELTEINLTPEEKFKALTSWVAGIAEAGLNAFKIQGYIDGALGIIYPISSFLMRFLVKIDPDFIHQFLFLIEKECMFEGKAHDASIISNLIPIVEMITLEWQYPKKINVQDITEETTKIVDAILDLNPPINLFNHKDYYPNFLFGASPKSILKFLDNIENSDEWIKFLEIFFLNLFVIKKKLNELEIEKLFKKILRVDLPFRIFEQISIDPNGTTKGFYQLYLYHEHIAIDFIKRILKNLHILSKTSINKGTLIDSLIHTLDFLDAMKDCWGDNIKSLEYHEELLSTIFELNPPLNLFAKRFYIGGKEWLRYSMVFDDTDFGSHVCPQEENCILCERTPCLSSKMRYLLDF